MKFLKQLQADFLCGAFTLMLIATLDVWLMISYGSADGLHLFALGALHVVFLFLFTANTTELLLPAQSRLRTPLMLLQFAIVCAVFRLSPNTFNAIMLVIWSAQLPYFVSFRVALLSAPLWSAVPWLFFIYHWQPSRGMVVNVLLFFTFNLFALIMMESRRSAELARAEAEQANREIRAMQSLLQQASKRDERIRIARDIHDVVGHHLTALSLQLQILTRKVELTHKADLEQSHALAKRLLADVRAAVSDMRDNEHIDLRQAMTALVDNLVGVEVKLDLPPSPGLNNVDHALVVLRCVQESMTNSIRHGRASDIWVQLQVSQTDIELTIEDNGCGFVKLRSGSGLQGMHERVSALGGHLQLTSTELGVRTTMTLPRRRESADG